MKICLKFSLAISITLIVFAVARAQTVNTSQQVLLEGLRTSARHGSFTGAAFSSDGSLLLLLDENDGVRVLKTDATANNVLAQAHMGAAGDTAVAMALDPSGNLYVTGTTTSGSLAGTAGTPFQSVADTSTNSFLAKYDSNLNLIFFTFLGAGRTAATAVTATADSAFVTGITFSTVFPVTAAGIQQSPAKNASENGFVERISASGTSLIYATYLTGANGSTSPAAIVADSNDNAYIAGMTSASGFPTISALQPTILGSSSGFLTSLNAAGSSFVFSTFIAGNGLNSMALDAASNTLLLTGNVALGQFPVATVAMPLTSASYQTLLRIPFSGQAINSSVLLVPGSQSFVSAGPNETAWISGALTTPLFPGSTQPDYSAGDSFLLHLTSANTIDQTMRFGGTAVDNDNYASLTSVVAAPAIGASAVALAGTLTAMNSSSLLATQRFDLPLVQAPTSALPNTLRDVVPTAATCGSSSQCIGTGALLAMVTTGASAPSLSLSTDDMPNLTLRNLGSSAATGVSVSVSGFTASSNCGATLGPSSQCTISITGVGPGAITITAANANATTVMLPANGLSPDAIALSSSELDFGVVSAVDGAALQTITVSNLSGTTQTFTSVRDGGATTSYSFAEASSDCSSGGAAGTHSLAANSSCHITLSLTASSSSTNDGPARAYWKIGTRDVVLTGFAQAAAISLSATEIDFGTQFAGTSALDLPRYLYLSNNSASSIAHSEAELPATSPFSITDNCPTVLEPRSVCQMIIHYLSANAPSADATTLMLDNGLSVLLTGQTLLPASVTGSATNPSLSVSTSALSFTTAVAVTQVSGTAQSVFVKNTGANAFTLTTSVSGDFLITSGCPASLAGGASCTLQVSFAPSQPGVRDGLLTLTAGSGFAATLVTLTGTASAILPANNGILALGETLVGEPLVAWYKIQQSIASLTATSNSSAFGVVLVEDTGSGHGSPAVTSFTQTATSTCGNCWLGVQFLSQTSGLQGANLTLSSSAGGSSYPLTLTATALPVQGLLLTPITQDFGPVAINSSSEAVTFTLANLLTNAASVNVQSVTVQGDFVIVANSTGGAACSGTLAATASCYVQIAFAPTAFAERSGTLTVVTSNGTVTAQLSGFGLADPGLAINPTSLSFGSVPGSAATQQTVTVSNTGAALLTVGAPTVSDPSFSVGSTCSTLMPGSICALTVGFVPQAANVAATLSLPVTSVVNGQTTSTTYSVSLAGNYTVQSSGLEILPNTVNYGSTATGGLGTTRTFTLNNLSGKALNVSLVLPRQFPLASPAPCATLAASGSCSFSVSFLPVTGGLTTGSVYANGSPVDGSAAVQTLAYMQGYGAAAGSLSITGLSIPNTGVSFGQVPSGQMTQQTLTLSNSGTGPLTIHRITSQPPFFTTSNCGTTLVPNTSCAVTLTYEPIYEVLASTTAAPRVDTGTLSIESDAVSSPDAVGLSGVAVPVVSSSPASSAVQAQYSLLESALTFTNTQVGGASPSQTITLTNTGTATIHILSVIASTDFTATTSCGTLLVGVSCTVRVQLTPTTASNASVRSGTLQILSDASTSLEFVSLLGSSTAAPLTISPAMLDFGTVDLGSKDALTVSVTNTASMPVTFLGLMASGDYSAASGSCPATGSTLAAGSSCAVSVSFTPTATGTRTGTLSLATDATQLPLTVALTGVGAAARLQASPGALSFGSVAVGAVANLTLTLLNTGTAMVTNIANAISGTNAGDFSVTVPCSVTSLAPNQGCTETVAFDPGASGARSAMLTLTSSDPNGPAVIALSGAGVQGGSFVLSVNGGSSASATVTNGSPAAFALTLTPQNGFTGPVALTCLPIVAGQYATCSLLSSTLTLSGGAMSSVATINTITSKQRPALGLLALGLLVPLVLLRSRRRVASALAMSCLLMTLLGTSGCGSGPSVVGGNILYTPAGSYQYQVTASSTSGVAVSSSVTLNVVVQ